MPNSVITNVDLGSIFLETAEVSFTPDEVTVPASTVYAEGTILARDSVTGKLIAFVLGGTTDGDGIPKTVLGAPAENDTAGPLEIPMRAPVTAKVRTERLIIEADGDGANVTKAVLDQLRDYGIFPSNVNDLSILDNQ